MAFLAISPHTGARLAEIGFLLILIAGVGLIAPKVQRSRWQWFRLIVAGAALTTAGSLLIIATRWGHFG